MAAVIRWVWTRGGAGLIGFLMMTVGLVARPCAAYATAADPGACMDEPTKADLDAKRRMRSVKDRLFQKTNRHEFTLRGGYYASDVFDGAPVAGAAYTYHLTEDFAVEASGAWTYLRSTAAPELERMFTLLRGSDRRSLLFATNLVVSPLYAKFQAGDGVVHFDVLFTLGAGVVDSALSSGVAGNAGFGVEFFVGRAMALRLDVRDYVYRQQLLARNEWVNDLATTLGWSVFLPFRE